MAEQRTHPPSARRRAVARRAGLHAASPILVGAIACGAALIAAVALAGAARTRLGAAIAEACRGADGGITGLRAAAAADAVVAIAMPVLAAAAIAAIAAHLAQTRGLWLPRRRIRGAPALAHGPGERTQGAAGGLASAAVIACCALGWLWSSADQLAALSTSPLAGAAVLARALAALAIAWAALGTLDALWRHAALSRALRMTAGEQREDARLGGIDPRWRAHRTKAAREPALSIAGAAVLVLGDGTAAAIAWDPARRPIPACTAIGRAAGATQLLGLARRHGIPVHRDPELAAALAEGPVAESRWARLAQIIAAVRR